MRQFLSRLKLFFGSQEGIISVGSVLIVFAATIAVVYWPMYTIQQEPSAIWKPFSAEEEKGRALYIANGCTYCHSQYIRPQDWGIGAERIAESGDYYKQRPHLLGSQRTGPDLSQEGGEHSNDWHLAHFINPRYTRPRSLMPDFTYLSRKEINELTAYVQSLGGQMAQSRMRLQTRFGNEAKAAADLGPDENIRWLHSRIPVTWRAMPSETPAVPASVARGEKVYQDYCIGCHGPVGDGNGPAAPYLYPKPLNFTTLKRHLVNGKYIGGILYYQIMNGITGTAMPYFKKDLESAKIWDVGNYVMVNFINHDDSRLPNEGLPVSFEGEFAPPVTDVPTTGSPEPIRSPLE